MHFLSFSLKRAHLRTLALVRPWLHDTPITPARFDLLYALRGMNCRVAQSALTRAVGLAAPTVSRTLRRLEELGLIRRARVMHDKRMNLVEFTSAGFHEFERVFRQVFRPGHLTKAYAAALGIGARIIAPLRRLHTQHRQIAVCFGDRSTLHFPFLQRARPACGGPSWLTSFYRAPPIRT